MNNFIGIGRVATDIELKYTTTGLAIGSFTIALDRGLSKEKKQEAESKNQQTADFIKVIAFKHTAEYIANYLKKGRLVGIQGRIQTGSYEKEGRKIYTTEILANNIEILEWEDKQRNNNNDFNVEGFSPTDDEKDLPF